MDNMLLKHLSGKVGVELIVRNKEEWMEESMDKAAEHLAKKQKLTRDTGVNYEMSEQEVIDKFYSKGNKVD